MNEDQPAKPTPDPGRDIAADMEYTHQRAFLDFDPRNPGKNVLGGELSNLASQEMEAVRSVGQEGILLTIYSRKNDGQDMADFLHIREDIIAVALSYARHYRADHEPGASTDFRLYILSAEEKMRIENATGHTLPEEYRS